MRSSGVVPEATLRILVVRKQLFTICLNVLKSTDLTLGIKVLCYLHGMEVRFIFLCCTESYFKVHCCARHVCIVHELCIVLHTSYLHGGLAPDSCCVPIAGE